MLSGYWECGLIKTKDRWIDLVEFVYYTNLQELYLRALAGLQLLGGMVSLLLRPYFLIYLFIILFYFIFYFYLFYFELGIKNLTVEH